MKRTALMLVFIAAGYLLQAQVSYRSYNTGGIVVGDTKSAYQVLTTHGIQYKTWYAGIGVGIDDHYNRTVPVVASLLKDILPGKNIFVHINAGPQFAWEKYQYERHFFPRDINGRRIYPIYERKSFPGFLGEAGLGYRMQIKRTGKSIMFGTYYSYKTHKEKQTRLLICATGLCPVQTTYVTSGFNRWAFKLGVVF